MQTINIFGDCRSILWFAQYYSNGDTMSLAMRAGNLLKFSINCAWIKLSDFGVFRNSEFWIGKSQPVGTVLCQRVYVKIFRVSLVCKQSLIYIRLPFPYNLADANCNCYFFLIYVVLVHSYKPTVYLLEVRHFMKDGLNFGGQIQEMNPISLFFTTFDILLYSNAEFQRHEGHENQSSQSSRGDRQRR